MTHWFAAAFVNRDHRLRNGWWVAAFLAVLATLLAPTIIVSAHLGREITIYEQALIIILATVTIQALRRRPISEVTGRANLQWIAHLGFGAVLGGLLMAAAGVLVVGSAGGSAQRGCSPEADPAGADASDPADPELLRKTPDRRS